MRNLLTAAALSLAFTGPAAVVQTSNCEQPCTGMLRLVQSHNAPAPTDRRAAARTAASEAIRGDVGFRRITLANRPSGYTVDLRGATLRHNTSRDGANIKKPQCETGTLQVNRVAVVVEGSPGLKLIGGRFLGTTPQNVVWSSPYCDGSAIAIARSPNASLSDMFITNVWDGVRFRIDSNGVSFNRVRMLNVRDDAIENDYKHSMSAETVLIENAGSCIAYSLPSSAPPGTTGANNTVRLRDFHCQLKAFPGADGRLTHGPVFKADSGTRAETNPRQLISNSTFAITSLHHGGYGRTKAIWLSTTCLSRCYYLNLSDVPFPTRYPKPPAPWQILQGKAAREHWAKVRAEWLARNPTLN